MDFGFRARPGEAPVAPERPPDGPRWSFEWLGLATLFLTLGVALLFAMSGPIAAIGRHVSFNPNEGWNAYWATRALAQQPLYTDASSPISNNYTPLSFYIVGWVGRWLGDFIVAGRIVCLAALLGCIFLVQQIVVELGGARRWAVAIASCALLFVAAAAPTYVAANDPHWLAELPMITALWLLVRHGGDRRSAALLALAGGLMLLSGLIKQSGIALPIAVTAWLALTDRRAMIVWLMLGAVGSALALFWLGRFGPTAIAEIAGHERVIHLRLIGSAAKTLTPLVPAMILAAIPVRARRHAAPGEGRLLLVLLFTGVATILGIVERMGTGTAQNVHFDAAIGLFILAGITLSRRDMSASWLVATQWQVLAFAFLVLPLVATGFARDRGGIARITDQARTERSWAKAIGFVHALPAGAACEYSALCYWAGQPFILDFSNYGQKLRRHDPAGLQRMIRQRTFPAIVSVRDKRYGAFNSRLPTAYNELIEANYRVQQVLPNGIYLLVPRTSR